MQSAKGLAFPGLPYYIRPMTLINQQAALDDFCASVAKSEYITVDTEFIRDKTYFPRLCLLQIATPENAVAIDPLAKGIDLAPVFALLQKPKLTKVFHAARQDIEIFHLLTGKIPAPLFDTQIAAAVCGYGESVGYETLVNHIVGQELDKSSRFTDWSARPLSGKQLAYALSDVLHLCLIYEQLKTKIETSGRMAWVMEEHAHLSDPALYQPDPDDAWKRLKYGNMRPKHLAVLRELARWREIEARRADVPRGRIVKDEALIELALSMPRKESDFTRMRGIAKDLSKEKMRAVMEGVEKAVALPAGEYPQVGRYRRPTENITGAVAMLQLLLKVQADLHGIASSMIAGKDDIEAIALGKTETPVLSGWRYDVFGKPAQALMQGRLKLSLNAKNKQVVFEEVA
jgi:ribonuclease D